MPKGIRGIIVNNDKVCQGLHSCSKNIAEHSGSRRFATSNNTWNFKVFFVVESPASLLFLYVVENQIDVSILVRREGKGCRFISDTTALKVNAILHLINTQVKFWY